MVGADVRVLEHRSYLVLRRGHLVVARLDRHAQLGELELGLHHAGEHALGDGAEVVVVELVALGRLRAEEGPARVDEVGPLEVELLVDQEVLLLGADGGEHARGGLVAQKPERTDGRARESVHRAQQRDLGVERLTGPRRERCGYAQQRSVGVLENERRAGRIPGGVAACLEGGAHTARGKGRSVGLALDELLARELGQGDAVAGGAEEGVVLLRREPGQGLEYVGVVGGAALERPLLHAQRNGVGQRRIERLALGQGGLQALEGLLGQAVTLHGGREHVLAEGVVERLGQVDRAEHAAVGAPLSSGHVSLAHFGHRDGSSEGLAADPSYARPDSLCTRVQGLGPAMRPTVEVP